MAHDRKKDLMVDFCIAYCGILAEHNICATNTTGRLVMEATGLPITLYMSCKQGGDQQIGARISYNELDMVIFLSDPSGKESYKEVTEICRLCDQQNVPFATNIATAEVLIRGLKDGMLDWRDIVNPKKSGK
jgi:methylglyoxal synthase